MRTSARIGFWFRLGAPLLFAAILFQTVTVAGGGYTAILITALLLTTAADVCFIQAFRQGGFAARCFSVLLILPTLFVVADFVRRASYLFSE